MPTRDVIKEGIYKILIDQNCYTDLQRLEWEKKVPDIILTYLHSQGLRLSNGEALIDETND